jgi:spoIIIJ-associated protein
VEWVETTGRTVAEALDAALDQLGVDEQEAEVQVLQEPQKGLFGRLRAEARVRVRIRPTRPRPKVERRDRRRRGERDRERRGGRNGGGSTTATKSGASRSDNTGNGAETPGGGGRQARSGGSEDGRSAQGQRGSGEGGSGGGSGRNRRRRGGNRGAKQQGAAVTDQTSETATGSTTTATGPDLEAQRVAVEEFLRGLVDSFGRAEATVVVRVVEEDTLEADIDGSELGLLVGPKGQTLQAIHELVRSMVQRQFVGQAHARVRVDVSGYRQRRREALERFTRTVAEKVQSTGRAVVLDPMGASDRKIVHDLVNEIDGLETVSEGEEPGRRVIIQPS